MKKVLILTAAITLFGTTSWAQDQEVPENTAGALSEGVVAEESVETSDTAVSEDGQSLDSSQEVDADSATVVTNVIEIVDTEDAEEAASEDEMVEEVAVEDMEESDVMPLIVIDNAPLTDVIRTLARQAQINFMFDPRITTGVDREGQPIVFPNVSIRFENVTPREALEAVLTNHGLELAEDSKTGISRVTYINPAALPPLFTEVIQLKYAPVAQMVEVLQPTMSQRSSIIPDANSSKLVVLATETELESIHELLVELDVAPSQVLIEANIMETSKNPKTVKGIDWTGTLASQNITFGNGRTTGTIESGDYDYNAVDANNNVTNISGSDYIEQITTDIGNGGLSLNTASGFSPETAFLNADGLSLALSFLNTQNDTKVVATPRTVTLDNQTARLSVTRAFPILEVTPGSSNSPAGSSTTYTNLGTILEVTPRISADNMIALKVVPEVSNIDGKDSQSINGLVNTANIYAIRKVETQVMIPSGHTLVMGGLINDEVGKGYTKVPVLGDAPFIGGLFRHESKERKRQNLLIFITPTIVEDGDFQETPTDFLATKKVDAPQEELLTPWDSARPYNWREQHWSDPISEED